MYLGLDLGTTNVKALLVDRAGSVLGAGSVPLERYVTPDGGVEQDIYEIWDATQAAIRSATARIDPASVLAVGVSSQGGALQLLDANDRPIARVISWLDGRGGPFDRRIIEQLGEEYLVEHLGANTSSMALGQLTRLKELDPELMKVAKRIGFVGDVIVGRLCGRRAHDPTSLSIGMLYNPSLGRADPDILDLLALREEQLPDLIPATTAAGRLGEEAADRTGLARGIPVSPAVHDQYAASVGAGSVHPGDVCLGTGTAWVLVANTAKLTGPVARSTFVCPHPVSGLFGQLLSMGNGGSALDWVLKLTGRESISGDRLDDTLDQVPPGSDGLRFRPLLLTGKKLARSMKPGGRLSGITLGHTSGHLLRAAVEGLSCELARHLGFFTAAALPVRRLVMCGVAAASRVTPQIVADLTGHPVSRVTEPSVSALGAAVIGRALVEQDVELRELAEKLTPSSGTVSPGENGPEYGRLLEEYLEPFGRG